MWELTFKVRHSCSVKVYEPVVNKIRSEILVSEFITLALVLQSV